MINLRADIDLRRQRIRAGILVAAMATALIAASLTGVSIARAGGGYREAADLTIGASWFNVAVLGFGFVNVLPMLSPMRRLPGMATLNARLAPIEPYGIALTMMLFTFAFATLLPFALADGWRAIQSGGEPSAIVHGVTAALVLPVAVIGLATLIARGDDWHRWAERRMARAAKQAKAA